MRYIVTYNNNISLIEQVYKPDSYTIVGEKYVILYFDRDSTFFDVDDSAFPKCYGLAQSQVLAATGINELRSVTGLDLYGNGVVVGIIDSGFDVRTAALRNADGSTKFDVYYNQKTGVELQEEEINAIINGENLSEEEINIVSENFADTEETGHGTMIASIVCGESDNSGFTGIVPNARIIGVALQRAEPMMYSYYNIDSSIPMYSEADIIQALDYVTSKAGSRPLVVILPFETNVGSHIGRGILEEYSNWVCEQLHRGVFVPAGNQAISKVHTSGSIFNDFGESGESKEVSILVNDDRVNAFVNVVMSQGTKPVIMIESPTGEIRRVYDNKAELEFVFEGSNIQVKINEYDNRSEKCMIYIRANNLSKGVWKIFLQAENEGWQVEYDCYLHIFEFSRGKIEFMSPVSENTITSPGDAILACTSGAYDSSTNKIYPPSGKRGINIKPEVSAPGVEVTAYDTVSGRYVGFTGTSVSTAVTAGVGAIIMQWAVVLNNGPLITGTGLKQLIIDGCTPMTARVPDNQWGYGAINVYGSFEAIRE